MPLSVALAALACGAAAWTLTPWARRLVETDSRWMRRAVPTALSVVGGAGAVLVSTSPAHAVGLGILAVACALLVARRSIRGVQVPFGPLMMLGAAAAIAWATLR